MTVYVFSVAKAESPGHSMSVTVRASTQFAGEIEAKSIASKMGYTGEVKLIESRALDL